MQSRQPSERGRPAGLQRLVSTAASADRRALLRYAWLSIAAAVLTIALKVVAWHLTGSVGLLSDAAESTVNLVAAVVALFALRVAARPPDDDHNFGHSKAEYFSAVVEGVMIVVAALFIIVTAVDRLIHPRDVEAIGIGVAVSALSIVVNAGVAWVLLRAGRPHRSITLVADGKHLLTDVATTVGVIVGIIIVGVTGWERLDPVIALLVAVNIIVVGWRLVSESTAGLMDTVIPDDEVDRITAALARFRTDGVDFHDVRTRMAGHQRFVQFHLLVPGDWTVQRGHDLVEEVETALRGVVDDLIVTVHLEPVEDPRSYESWRM